jgi:hypothetical protein
MTLDFPAITDPTVRAVLVLAHPDLDPVTVSQQLALVPTRVFKKGDLLNGPNGAFPSLFGAWYLSSAPTVSSAEIRVHLDWLLAQLSRREAALAHLRSTGHSIDLECTCLLPENPAVPALTSQQLRALVNLGFDLKHDVSPAVLTGAV